jgi:hypothetical protein
VAETDDGICTWSDLPADQCAHCRQDELEAGADVVLRWFDARFASQLACGHQALEGQTIGVTTDGDYVCRRCGT